MKRIVFDTSTIISISEKCMSKIMAYLAEQEKIEFYIPESVYYEAVSHPIEIKRFEFNAIRIREMLDKGIIRLQKSNAEVKKLTQELHQIMDSMFSFGSRPIDIVHEGEAECLAVMKYLDSSILAIDERTTRMLIEEPQNLAGFLSKRHNQKININKTAVQRLSAYLGKLTIIRSVELLGLSYEKNCFNNELPHTKEALEAALFALKYGGCAISAEEILAYMKGVQ